MRICAPIIVGLMFLLMIPPPASATEAESGSTGIWRGQWNGEELTVAVITRGHEISDNDRQDSPWWQWGNTSTDAYLFYWSDDQMVDLILDFSMEDGRPEAKLYAPRVVEFRAAVEIFEGAYTLPVGLTPDLTISPVEGEWLIDGLPNFDLQIQETDPTTGEPSWDIRVGGERPGVPEWMIRNAISTPEEERYGGFGATMRMDPSVPFDLAEPLLPSWPYLSAVNEEGHWDEIQPIFYSYRARTLVQNWTGFHIAGMYQINSLAAPPETNFESPFAFYRFDEDAERYANLVVRSDIWPAGDPNGPSPRHAQRTAVRMTWTGEVPELWRYSLSVLGDHAHEDEVQIGDTVIEAVPYEEYPSWIVSKPWKGATFVEATEGETGSEGIYDYSVEDNPAATAWVTGIRAEQPRDVELEEVDPAALTLDQLEHNPIATLHAPYTDFPEIHPLRLKEGFRGEYSLNYDRIPRLYFSPVDNRPHLLYAQEGLWNLGDGSVLRVYNLDGGPHVDAWVREDVRNRDAEIIDGISYAAPGTVEESLYTLGDFLLYSSENEVQIRSLEQELENKPLSVPEDEDSWDRFLDTAESEDVEERDPHDLSGWPQELAGDGLTIRRAEASDVRVTDSGFRFVIELKTNYRARGTDHAGLKDLEAGSYVVNYDTDRKEFSVEPLTPPLISVSLSRESATEREKKEIAVALHNDGRQDVVGATLAVTATSEQGEVTSAGSTTVDLLGLSTATATVEWAPPGPGEWKLTPTVTFPDEEPITFQSTLLTVVPGEDARPFDLLAISTTTASRVLVVLVLCLFAGMAGLVWTSQWMSSSAAEAHDEHQPGVHN